MCLHFVSRFVLRCDFSRATRPLVVERRLEPRARRLGELGQQRPQLLEPTELAHQLDADVVAVALAEDVARRAVAIHDAELLADAGSDIQYAAELSPLDEKPLAVLCAMIEEDRPAFLEFLKVSGIENLSHRQRVTNALTKALREGRVTRGWAKPVTPKWETQCAHCGKPSSETVKLSICTRCKAIKYCGAACQKAAWPKHKLVCKVCSRAYSVKH